MEHVHVMEGWKAVIFLFLRISLQNRGAWFGGRWCRLKRFVRLIRPLESVPRTKRKRERRWRASVSEYINEVEEEKKKRKTRRTRKRKRCAWLVIVVVVKAVLCLQATPSVTNRLCLNIVVVVLFCLKVCCFSFLAKQTSNTKVLCIVKGERI